jgi:hypothetical protein
VNVLAGGKWKNNQIMVVEDRWEIKQFLKIAKVMEMIERVKIGVTGLR